MEKKSYAKISFTNCMVDFDYTICTWDNVNDYVDLVKQEAEALDEKGFLVWSNWGWLPEVKVSVVMMTDDEFSEWFSKNVNP